MLLTRVARVCFSLFFVGVRHRERRGRRPRRRLRPRRRPTRSLGDMQGISWTGATDPQKKLAFDISSEQKCDCGCGMTLATCRVKDAKCGRSLALVNQVVDLAKQGKSKDDIVKTALAPPSFKFVQFDLKPGEAPSIGPADAKVTVLEYYDYQCPFCVRVAGTLEQLAQQYPKDVRVVFKMHPLPMHSNAMIAAQAALAAQAQGKFLDMHKKLFENSSQLSRDKVLELAKGLGLDADRFTKDLDSDAVKTRIAAESKEAEGIGANGTPAAFVNGRYVSGAKPLEFFKDMVDEELKWAKDGNRPTFKTAKNVSETMPPSTAKAGLDPNKVYAIPVANAPVMGASKPKVTLIHYYDYQCPFCVRVHPTLDQLLKDYPNDLEIAYKQHPLPFHQFAMPASEAALAAKAQGKFPEMHEKLMAMNSQPSRDKLLEAAKAIGMDVDRFTKDLDNHTYKAEIDAMTKEAMDVGATGTPASFINGRYLSGAQPVEAFKQIIDDELKKATRGGS
jgi:protein-disulfide isomerase